MTVRTAAKQRKKRQEERTVSRPRLYSLPFPFSNAEVTMRNRPRSPYGSPCRRQEYQCEYKVSVF